MKNLLFFAILVFATFSCSKEDSCSTSDWVGTYTGNLTCNGSTDPVSVEIKEGTNGSLIIISDGEEDTVTPNGCTVTMSEDTGLGVLSVTINLSGNDLTYKISGSFFGEAINCSTTLKK